MRVYKIACQAMEGVKSKMTRFHNLCLAIPEHGPIPFDIRQEILEIKQVIEQKAKDSTTDQTGSSFNHRLIF